MTRRRRWAQSALLASWAKTPTKAARCTCSRSKARRRSRRLRNRAIELSILYCTIHLTINHRAQKKKPGQPSSKRDRNNNRQVASASFVTLARSFSFGLWLVALLLATTALCDPSGENHKEFRVCADPNNLPFSNQKQEG